MRLEDWKAYKEHLPLFWKSKAFSRSVCSYSEAYGGVSTYPTGLSS